MKCICGYPAVDARDLSLHIIQGKRAGGQHAKDTGTIEQAHVVIEPAQAQPLKSKPATPKQSIDRKWYIIGLAAVGWLASIGLAKLVFGIEQQSYMTTGPLSLVVLAMFFGCPVVIWRTMHNSGGRRKTKVVNPVITPDGQMVSLAVQNDTQVSKERGVQHVAPDVEGDVNAFKIHVRPGQQELGEHPVVPVLSYFCHVPDNELLGQPRQLRNDKKWYHILVAGPEPNMLRPLVVGDASFMDPRVMSRYLDAPCQRSYIEFVRENMAKWIGPGLLALMDGILLLVIYLRVSAPPPVP